LLKKMGKDIEPKGARPIDRDLLRAKGRGL
jgi:hypothetical protein